MSDRNAETHVVDQESSSGASDRIDRRLVFFQWSLRREALSLWSYVVLVMPLLVAGYFSKGFIVSRLPQIGPDVLRTLSWIAAFFILVGGVRHASKAVCWEVSRELKDLIRLTGIDPRTMLWCKSLSRWWTIGLSILLILPLAMYARTMGAIQFDQWLAGGCWLLMLTALVAGFAMIASVSSNQVSNPETTAATATFLLMVLYHVAFWGFAAFIGIVCWLISGNNDLPSNSLGRQAVQYALDLAPIAGLSRGLASPSLFSPLDVRYWCHFLTAGFCLWAASIVIQNRFRVTTLGDDPPVEMNRSIPSSITVPYLRPRCSDQPFYWKDSYILGGGNWSRSWWTAISLLAVAGVISGVAYGVSLIVGIVAICAAPCLVAVRFDALLVPEFREQTWNSLMLLPVDPRVILFEKLRAVLRERIAIFVPVCIAAAFAMASHATAVLMTSAIAMIAGVLMIEVSILNQFYSKIGLAQSAIAFGIILAIAALVPLWAFFEPGTSFAITMMTMLFLVAGFYWLIHWKLRTWSEG